MVDPGKNGGNWKPCLVGGWWFLPTWKIYAQSSNWILSTKDQGGLFDIKLKLSPSWNAWRYWYCLMSLDGWNFVKWQLKFCSILHWKHEHGEIKNVLVTIFREISWLRYTPWKLTNSSPKKRPFQKENSSENPLFFRDELLVLGRLSQSGALVCTSCAWGKRLKWGDVNWTKRFSSLFDKSGQIFL